MNCLKHSFHYMLLLSGILLTCCANSKKEQQKSTDETTIEVKVPSFDADSAYRYVKAQTDFGPRVPNTAAHRACADYLNAMLEQFGAKVVRQDAEVIAYDGTLLKAQNIIGSYKPDEPRRILLCAHWDSRPFADQDDEAYHHTPIDGANDGASGVGVLLEIARQISLQAPELGIDIAFFDAEDYGTPEFHTGGYDADSWCLGTQYWGRIPHVTDYKARFGILLDMVGGKNATFYYEQYSAATAREPMLKIWNAAERIGYGNYFIKQTGGNITDDHIYVNRLRQIPCVDIIDFNPNSSTGFNSTWHTRQDTFDKIDKQTLKAVGQTVMEVIYKEH